MTLFSCILHICRLSLLFYRAHVTYHIHHELLKKIYYLKLLYRKHINLLNTKIIHLCDSFNFAIPNSVNKLIVSVTITSLLLFLTGCRETVLKIEIGTNHYLNVI